MMFDLRLFGFGEAQGTITLGYGPWDGCRIEPERRFAMADEKTMRGGQDRTRINLSEEYEVRYWTEALGVSRERLEELVRQHGNSVEKIRAALKKAA